MKITVDGEVFEYDSNRLLNTEAIALQKVTGMRVQEWVDAMAKGDAFALTGLVWLLWRRNGRETSFDEVEFDIGALDLQDDEEEPVEDPTVPALVVETAAPDPARPVDFDLT